MFQKVPQSNAPCQVLDPGLCDRLRAAIATKLDRAIHSDDISRANGFGNVLGRQSRYDMYLVRPFPPPAFVPSC